MKKAAPELEAEARAFVRRYARAYSLDPKKIWRERREDLLKLGLEWFLNDRTKQDQLSADYRSDQPKVQWPHVETPAAPDPAYRSFADYLMRTAHADRMARCYARAKRANRKRLMSPQPERQLTREDVWHVMLMARGRCTHCGSLAVESMPLTPDGKTAAWAQVGRRIGSLEHRRWRAHGGDNDLSNLAWSCMWCNTWQSERRQGATDHGGFHPPPNDPAAIAAMVRQDQIVHQQQHLARLRRSLTQARTGENWEKWREAAEGLIEVGEKLEPDDYDLLQELTEPDGPETYCIDEDWLYFGPGGRAWR